MSGPDWIRWYSGKWLTGTLGLNPEQKGVYIDVISVIYDRGECPTDFAWLAKLCGCRKDKVERIVGQLCEKGKLTNNGRTIANVRANLERSAAINFSLLQSSRVSKRWKNNDIADTIPLDTNTTTTTTTKKESDSSSPKPNGHHRHTYDFDAFWACWDIPGTKRGQAAAEKKYRAIIKSDAALHEQLCAGVKRYMAWCRRERRELQYVKHPATWLNQGCWADELPCRGSATPSRPQSNTEALLHIGDDE